MKHETRGRGSRSITRFANFGALGACMFGGVVALVILALMAFFFYALLVMMR